MEKKIEISIRAGLVLLGISIIIFSLYSIFSQIYELILKNAYGELLSNIDFFIPISIFIIGFIIIMIGKSWDNFFKALTKTIISVMLFILVLSFVFISINSHSKDISNSIQPTVDYLVVSSLDEILSSQIPTYNNSLKVSFSEDIEIEKLYFQNITLPQATKFINSIGLDIKSDEDKIEFSKFLITTLYLEIKSNTPENLDTGISTFSLNEMINNNFDINTINQIDAKTLKTLYESDNDAFLVLIYSSNTKINEINPSKLTNIQAEEIWNYLKFNQSISIDTKKTILMYLFSGIGNELESYDINSTISLDSLSTSIPQEIKPFTNYDLFSNNISVRVEQLNKVRSSCKISKIEIEEICNIANATLYENLILMVKDQSTNNSNDLSLNMTSVLTSIETKEKVELLIEQKTKNGIFYLFLSIFLLILAFISYYLHFKLFNRELIKEHIPYYIFKINLFQYIPTFIMILIFYFLIKSSLIFDFLKQNFTQIPFNFDILLDMPIYKILIQINKDLLLYSIIYLVLSLILYATFYIILKKKIALIESN